MHLLFQESLIRVLQHRDYKIRGGIVIFFSENKESCSTSRKVVCDWLKSYYRFQGFLIENFRFEML